MNKTQLIKSLKQQGFSGKILNAFSKVSREDFVPEHIKQYAYENEPQPIGQGQTISQPYTIAKMLEMLDLKKGQKVLEVGSGCGYVLALIKIITKSKVYGIEIIKELAEKSRNNLRDYQDIKVYNKNGAKGLSEHSPFERILISAACKEVPKTLLNQLAENGILVAPVGEQYDCSLVAIQKKKGEYIEKKKIDGFSFVKFVDD